MTLLRTGVGSLPHRDAAAAAEFVVSSADVAYLPQLPNRHDQESMLVQWGDGMFNAGQQGTSLRLDTPIGNRAEAFGGATVTLQQLAAGPIKTQATGPVTLAAALRSAGVAREGLLDLVADALVERIQSHLAWVRRSAGLLQVQRTRNDNYHYSNHVGELFRTTVGRGQQSRRTHWPRIGIYRSVRYQRN